MGLIVKALQVEYESAAVTLLQILQQRYSKLGLHAPECMLELGEHGLSLVRGDNQFSALRVDFTAGTQHHRRLYGGGKGQLIAKAVGLSKGVKPQVLDCTAGLGRDAFVLAALGCKVTMLERHPIVHALLDDGLKRAINSQDIPLRDIVGRMPLHYVDALSYLQTLESRRFDVIVLDPMFPSRKKSALVKKDMQIFHQLLGSDCDSDELLTLALQRAGHRVVVKRPATAPALRYKTSDQPPPMYSLKGKSSRYDIYSLKRFN